MTIRLLVVEDHPVVRLGIQLLLDNQPDIEIVGETGTAATAIILADMLGPDIVLMDIGLPDGSGIDASAEIKRRQPQIAIVALTIFEDAEYIDKMIAIGASGFISKRAAPDELVAAIRCAANGRSYFNSNVVGSGQ